MKSIYFSNQPPTAGANNPPKQVGNPEGAPQPNKAPNKTKEFVPAIVDLKRPNFEIAFAVKYSEEANEEIQTLIKNSKFKIRVEYSGDMIIVIFTLPIALINGISPITEMKIIEVSLAEIKSLCKDVLGNPDALDFNFNKIIN